MASRERSLSTLVESQLPDFISSEYPKFVKFVQKYYEHLENSGQPLDIISNLSKYQDIDTYEKSILSENSTLVSIVEIQNGQGQTIDWNITVANGSSFPEKNGYILIDEECIFYKNRVGNLFTGCYRNVSATTRLGDLYNSSTFKNVEYKDLGTPSPHDSGVLVYNISNLFLYAFVKNFENQYLASFPKENLKPSVDKKTLIKNIKSFYRSKGTEQSIKFIFNAVVSTTADDVPSVYYPKDYTIKSSNGDWINKYALKVKVASGDVTKLVGKRIYQESDKNDSSIKYATAVIDAVTEINGFYEIVLAPETVIGNFDIIAQTSLTKAVSSGDSAGKNVNVYSTLGWNNDATKLVIGNEVISYSGKSVSQFTIAERGFPAGSYSVGTEVYSYSNLYGKYIENNVENIVKIIPLGVIYDLKTNDPKPYSNVGDVIQISRSGFESRNPILWDEFNSAYRWKINEINATSLSAISAIQSKISEVNSGVNAIFEDDQYFYVASSGYPAHNIGKSSWSNVNFKDQRHLKLIRKSPSRTTEVYNTTTDEVGILVNGVTVRSYRDDEQIVFGEITNIKLKSSGSGYEKPPFVLIQDGSGSFVAKARAILSGDVVDSIEVLESGSGFFPPVPEVTITSGRNAKATAIVTGDKVTSLKITNPGEYYSSPPQVIIRDSAGQGRFARFESIISDDGKLIGFTKIDEGKFYTQENIVVEIVAVGSGATAVSSVRTWNRNRYTKLRTQLDDNNGFYFRNKDESLGFGYSYVANPKQLRVNLNDNLSSSGVVPLTLTHSPILGYAYDGNPIYGPYGFSNSSDPTSSIARMTSSYVLKRNRTNGPALSSFPLGSFIEDYDYLHRSGTLDENNGRFCVTPEYPEGTYAYFLTIDSSNNPVFPYIIGKSYYSIPVDANYNKIISQKDIPQKVSRLRTQNTPENGSDVYAFVDDVSVGNVSSIDVFDSQNKFSVGGQVVVDYSDNTGSDVSASVSWVRGIPISEFKSSSSRDLTRFPEIVIGTQRYNNVVEQRNGSTYAITDFNFYQRNGIFYELQGFDSALRCVKITTETPCYFYQGDIITHSTTGATGTLIGDVEGGKELVVEETTGRFVVNSNTRISSSISVLNLLVNSVSNFTKDAEVTFTNGNQSRIISVSGNRLSVASNPFVDGDPIIFSSAFSNIQADTIYYVIDASSTTFKVSATLSGSEISLSSSTSPGIVALSQKAKGVVLETVQDSNTVKVRVVSGDFTPTANYYIRSSFLRDTSGSFIVTTNSLSSNIKIINVDEDIAIAKTSSAHGISVGDQVELNFDPDDSRTETRIYVRKRIYQDVQLNSAAYTKTISDTGIGSFSILNGGADYAGATLGGGVFQNVELIFADINKCRDEEGRIVGNSARAVIGKPGNANNARADITVGYNKVASGATSSSVTPAYIVVPDNDGLYIGQPVVGNGIDNLTVITNITKLVSGSYKVDINKPTIGVVTNVVFSPGIVTNVVIQSRGRGYKRSDLLAASTTSLGRLGSSTASTFFTGEVQHVGFGKNETRLRLNNIDKISRNDFLQISDEIVQVADVDIAGAYVDVLRAQNNTIATNHFNGQSVSHYDPQYRFVTNFRIGSTNADPTILSYDRKTGIARLVFDLDKDLSTITRVSSNFSFFDSSSPAKLVTVTDVKESAAYKFEFSTDNVNWNRNPILKVQKYYKYTFDTSSPTLLGSYLEFSPSGNFNILTNESVRTAALPGNANSSISVKFGYGPALQSNNYTVKKSVDFSNFYYFDKNGIVSSDKSYLRLVDDPLQGLHTVSYVTATSFVYQTNTLPDYSPQYTNIFYDTNSRQAVGKISKINLANSGKNFNKLPSIVGINFNNQNECLTDVVWDEVTKSIIAVRILSTGLNYSKPKAVVTSGNGSGAVFEVIKNSSGGISIINVLNKGSNYTFKPTVKIVETDIKAYFTSKNIGVPQSVKLVFNGNNFNKDFTISKKFSTPQILVLKNFDSDAFLENEKITQSENGRIIAEGFVSKNGWNGKTNVLKLEKITGSFKKNLPILGTIKNKTAFVTEVFSTLYNSNVSSYYDNLGYYNSDRSKLGEYSQKLADSYFYQDYSYVIKSKTPIDVWRNLILKTTHPAGFKLFGEVLIESEGDGRINPKQPGLSNVSIIQLWDPEKNKISVEKTYRTVTQTQVALVNTNVSRGKGSVFIDAFNDAEISSSEVYLTPAFNGYFDETGKRSGTRTFTITSIGSNLPVFVPKAENLILTLDGILQIPNKSFTLSGTQITFTEAPLGYRSVSGQPISTAQYKEGVDSPSQKVVAKILRFKSGSVNNDYFRSIKNISSEFDGVKTIFDLKDINNNNITLDAKENLIVTLDGILQETGVTPLIPYNRAYYIRKNVVPNQIVFANPPKAGQQFTGHSISNYERLKIDMSLVNGSLKGPFIMKSVLNNKAVDIFDDKNILVFVDGVLQKKNKSYSISGSSITFSDAPKQLQNINILYFYGRNTVSSLTAFEFEDDKFFNYVKVSLDYIPSVVQYSDKPLYQGVRTNPSASGILKSVRVTSTGSELILLTQNSVLSPTLPITIINGNASGGGDIVVPSSSIISISPFVEDEDTNDILIRDNAGWLFGSSITKKSDNFIDIGDKIKIDGENNYRSVLSVPSAAFKTQYNSDSSIGSNFYGKISVTPNDEITRGEGLVVYAEIDANGSISALKWNDRQYNTYGVGRIQPGAYTYVNAPKLKFIPRALRDDGGNIISPAQGGGAEAYVIESAGEVIDVILTNPGSGYLTPPRVVVTRGFDIVKKPERKINTDIVLSLEGKITTNFIITTAINLEYLFAVHSGTSIISKVSELEPSRQITQILPAFVKNIDSVRSVVSGPYVTTIESKANITSSTTVTKFITIINNVAFDSISSATVENVDKELEKLYSIGFVDFYADKSPNTASYTLANLGTTLKTFENSVFISTGIFSDGASISGMSLEQFEKSYGDIVIEDFELRPNSAKATVEETLMNIGYASITEYGAYLDNDLEISDTVVYVPNTSRFPSSGVLMVGTELLFYTSKLSDRFTGVTRGYLNTEIQYHAAGSYLRSVN